MRVFLLLNENTRALGQIAFAHCRSQEKKAPTIAGLDNENCRRRRRRQNARARVRALTVCRRRRIVAYAHTHLARRSLAVLAAACYLDPSRTTSDGALGCGCEMRQRRSLIGSSACARTVAFGDKERARSPPPLLVVVVWSGRRRRRLHSSRCPGGIAVLPPFTGVFVCL